VRGRPGSLFQSWLPGRQTLGLRANEDGWLGDNFPASAGASAGAALWGAERCASARDSCCSNRPGLRPRAAKCHEPGILD
jgi:hypothetical protein